MEKVADLFDDWAARGRGEGMEAGHGQTAGHLVASLPLGSGKSLLDVGCGNGWASRQAAAAGAHATGVDVSDGMVQRAAKAAHEAGPEIAGRCRFLVADAADLPFDDGSFDAAWSMEALYYAPEPDRVLAELARVLRSGAPVHVVLDFYEENAASHSWPTDVGVPMVRRSEAAWCAALEAAGFVDVVATRLRANAGPGVEAWKVQEGSLHLAGVRA